MYFNERPGRVRVVRDGRLQPRPLALIPTTTDAEMGLLGMAVAPDDDFVYVFATAPDGATNRVYRVRAGGGAAEAVVEGLPASVYHNGGGVAFSSDGSLLVSNGDRHEDDRAQDPAVLGGKVYRFTAQGTVPRDNPFGDSPTFALGLRNPYGLAVDPVSGDPFVTDNGPDEFDEINRVRAGGNYGWPLVVGPGSLPGEVEGTYHEPLLSYRDIVVPTGIAFAEASRRLGQVSGDLFFATYGEQAIHRVQLDGRRERALSDEIVIRSPEPVVALAWGPRGLYFSTPTSVRVLPFSRTEAGDATRTPRSAPPEADEGRPSPRSKPSVAGRVVQVFVAALLLAALAWSLGAGRRGRRPGPDHRDGDG